jgi:hypothetical protein
VRYFQSLLDVTLIQFNNAELDAFDRAAGDQSVSAQNVESNRAL